MKVTDAGKLAGKEFKALSASEKKVYSNLTNHSWGQQLTTTNRNIPISKLLTRQDIRQKPRQSWAKVPKSS